MHIVLEGVLPIETKMLLNYCIDENFFSLHLLNESICHFSYGRKEAATKVPREISKKDLSMAGGSLKLHLSGMSVGCM